MRGKSVLTTKQADTVDSHGIEEIIASKMREQGLEVTTNIGCSEYKIDIGIVHPKMPGEYILGIMCDGDRYRHSGTSRDRNILQESVLKSLGWNVHRVWILDWWENPSKELIRIQDSVTEALSGKQDEPEEVPVTPNVEDFERIDESECTADLPTYTICTLAPEDRLRGNSEEFAQPYMANHICDQLAKVLAVEAPISRTVLCKRVLEAWGITRMGARIDRTFDGILAAMRLPRKNGAESTFHWNPGQNIAEYANFRVPTANEQTRRNMEDIAPEEIAAAAKYVLQVQYSLTTDDLVKEIAILFGFSRYAVIN